jgi:hypothetical protein
VAQTHDLIIFARTRNLRSPQSVPIRIHARAVASRSNDALAAFCRSDTTITAAYDYQVEEERGYPHDINLWRVTWPVVRVSAHLPSQEILRVPCIEPVTTAIDIGPLTERPPAIPEKLAVKARKWYANRRAMGLEQKARDDAAVAAAAASPDSSAVAGLVRRREAAAFVGRQDKKLVLEPTKRR